MSKIILITGCSTGIGRDLAKDLTTHGFTVIATARRLDAIRDLKAAMQLQLDVTDNESVTEAVNRIIQQFGRIDVLINNAGYGIRCAVEELSDDLVEKMFDVNVYGIIRMVRAVLPLMREQGSGRIINIGSIAGKIAQPVNGAYCASKYAMEALSDALRMEMARFGIQVVLIEPGNIKTNFPDTARNISKQILTNSNSVYYDLYQNYLHYTSNARRNIPGPEAVSRIIRKTIEIAKPKARYKAAVPLIHSLLPYCNDGLRDYLIKIAFKLGRIKKIS